MSRINVYVPAELAAAARDAGLNVSALTQEAIAAALARVATETWLAGLPEPGPVQDHGDAMTALAEARAELGV